MLRIKLIVLLMVFGVLDAHALAQSCKESKMLDWSARMTDNGDGTITDSKTKLTWMRCTMGMVWDGKACTKTPINYHWRDIQDELDEFVYDGGYAGKKDWRLPTRKELESIIEPACKSPSLDTKTFSYTPSSFYWSTDIYPDNDKWVWVVGFLYGGSYLSHKRDSWHLRLVR